jgi:hypothetical protein
MQIESQESTMNRTYNPLSRTESAAVAFGASVLSIVTVGAVVALFASAAPAEVSSLERIVLDTVVITAAKPV